MSLQKYRKVKYLGKGSYGAAILVQLRSNPKQTFVIKEIVIGHLKEAEKQSAKTEVEVLKQMTHSNITMYIESFVEGSKLYIVMEHADGGDLSNAITRRKTLGQNWPEEEVMRIFVQICLALKHVHDQNILHRDLKSQNIFLTTKGIVKLGDFGIAKVLEASEQQARTQIGTPYYLSPEICESLPYGRSSDIWSLGVVLFELLALELPFQANSLPALVVRICSAEPSWNKVEKNYSGRVVELNKLMLTKKSDKRPTILQIVRSDYIIKHVSQLLSYTLQMGKGGAETSASGDHLDPEAADRDIERARDMHRKREIEQEKLDREAAIQAQRAEQRAEEREKLRRFRQDMIRRKDETSPSKEVQVYAPQAPSAQQQQYHRRDTSPDTPPRNRDARNPKQSVVAEAKYEQHNHHIVPAPRGHHNQHHQQYDDDFSRHREEAKALYLENQRRAQCNRSRAVGHHIQQPSHYHNDNSAVVSRQHSGASDFESAARMEYFANRAAAQQFKARVEAERGVGNFPALPAAAPSSANRKYRDNYDDPTAHIAAVKAQRERERNQQLAEQEQQLQAAYEANREERRRLQEKRLRDAAVSYDDEMNENQQVMCDYSAADRQRQKESNRRDMEAKEREEIMRRAAAEQVEQRRALKKRGKAEAVAFEINFNDDAKPVVDKMKKRGSDTKLSENDAKAGEIPTSAAAPPPRQRKGWGMPVVPPAPAAATDESPAAEVEEEDHVRALYGTSEAKEIAEDEEVVLRCLEARQDREHDARMHAREVFRKLREKRRKEAMKLHDKEGGARQTAAKVRPPVARSSLDSMMQQVANANAEVAKTVNSAAKHGYKTETSADEAVAEMHCGDSSNDDELEKTLDKWLAKKGAKQNRECKGSDAKEEQRERSNTVDDDGEMAGLQCMLANALMGDEDGAADNREDII